MANLLRLVTALVEDREARDGFRADPDGTVAGFDDLCAEDVTAVVDLVRVQVEPGLADRLTDTLGTRRSNHPEPRRAAIDALRSVCDVVETDGPDASRPAGEAIPERPPHGGRPSHLWAVDGAGETSNDEGADETAAAHLQPVPDPPGGFVFSPLELVCLPQGVPDAGIEPGALATVVAVHHEPELHYEVEVSDDDGSRRFLGTVPPSAIDRY